LRESPSYRRDRFVTTGIEEPIYLLRLQIVGDNIGFAFPKPTEGEPMAALVRLETVRRYMFPSSRPIIGSDSNQVRVLRRPTNGALAVTPCMLEIASLPTLAALTRVSLVLQIAPPDIPIARIRNLANRARALLNSGGSYNSRPIRYELAPTGNRL
jgi:hypothetical protein